MKYSRKIFGALILSISLITPVFSQSKASAPSKKKWTLLVFVEGRNNLNNFARRNILDMAKVGSNERANILVQWYQPRQKTWRYRIEKENIVPVQEVKERQKPDISQDVVDSMSWAVKNYPAEHYGLILWNHGLGVLDPQWNKSTMM